MRVIGMISGTSFDAIEAVAVEFELSANVVSARLLAHESVAYAPELRSAIGDVLPPGTTTVEQICHLDTQVGQSFAQVAARMSKDHFGGEVDVVCSHGQTVFHWVEDGHALGTFQIGQGAWIAETTGATVVFDVRSRDVANGGHGAPLASLLDVLLLGSSPSSVRGALNLGGIANVTVVGPTTAPIAFDIGPANALMDNAVEWLTKGDEVFDADGTRASAGTVDERFLAELLDDPFYSAPAPKSTGKEYFHIDYLLAKLGDRVLAPNDLIATLCALTAETVANAVKELGVTELFASGGGTRNPVLMAEIKHRLPDVKLSLVDDFGIDESAKEAALMALIGFLTVHGLTSTVASCTGARAPQVLGAIIPGRQHVSYLDASEAPTSIVFETTKG